MLTLGCSVSELGSSWQRDLCIVLEQLLSKRAGIRLARGVLCVIRCSREIRGGECRGMHRLEQWSWVCLQQDWQIASSSGQWWESDH